MQLAILSDVHDNIWKLEQTLPLLQDADALIFCGDFCAPFTLKQLAEGFSGPIHAVFGNNDGDRFLLSRIAAGFDHVRLHGEFAELELDGLRVAVNHYPEIARALASSGRYDAVFYGHDHTLHMEQVAKTHFINPGEIMGRFGRSTFVRFDTLSREGGVVDVESGN